MQAGPDSMRLPPQPCRIDPHIFRQLMQMAGQDLAPSLMAQMRQDLWQIARAITLALAPADCPALRRQIHILVAISGSAGAIDLQIAAQKLGQATHAQPLDPALLQLQAARVLEGLYSLILYIESAIFLDQTTD